MFEFPVTYTNESFRPEVNIGILPVDTLTCELLKVNSGGTVDRSKYLEKGKFI